MIVDDFLPCLAGRFVPGVISRGPSDAVCLTFDDGPDPNITPRLLDVLARHSCRATFFVSGRQTELHPEIVSKALDVGHIIGSHGYEHQSLALASHRRALDDLRRAADLISRITGQTPQLYRPPYGQIGLGVLMAARELKMKVVLWTISAADWRQATANDLVKRVTRRIKAGDVVVLHDRGRYAEVMLEALTGILRAIEAKGLKAGLLWQDFSPTREGRSR